MFLIQDIITLTHCYPDALTLPEDPKEALNMLLSLCIDTNESMVELKKFFLLCESIEQDSESSETYQSKLEESLLNIHNFSKEIKFLLKIETDEKGIGIVDWNKTILCSLTDYQEWIAKVDGYCAKALIEHYDKITLKVEEIMGPITRSDAVAMFPDNMRGLISQYFDESQLRATIHESQIGESYEFDGSEPLDEDQFNSLIKDM